MAERQAHPIAPVFDEMSRILILGSFPSVKSREAGFFYGHIDISFFDGFPVSEMVIPNH